MAFNGSGLGKLRITEMIMAIPTYVLALVLAGVFGGSIFNTVLVVGVLTWPSIARVVRAEYLTLKQQTFVEAAKSIGISQKRILFSEILPNALPSVIVIATYQMAYAILLESGLSFLGAGDPNIPSWGKMIYDAQRFLRQAWWMAFTRAGS